MSSNRPATRLPLIRDIAQDDDWIVTATEGLSRHRFLAVVAELAGRLLAHRYAINLCEDRLNFMTGFAAALTRSQTVLLPSNRSPGAIAEVLDAYPDSYVLSDGVDVPEGVSKVDCAHMADVGGGAVRVPMIDADHVAAIVFTSGSTGRAQPNAKTWGALVKGAELAQRRLDFGPDTGIVATVPPQHMYGLETSILVPMITGARVFGGRPFFPEDIRQALDAMTHRPTLISTPVHLRACLESGLNWPELERLISATAPMDKALAAQIETQFQAPVMEIYGCTEAGSLASRRTRKEAEWKLYDGFHLRTVDGENILGAEHLETELRLSDVLEIVDPHHFQLLGRHADMLNVAGKRASLSDLNLKLNAISGVKDAVFVLPERKGRSVPRLAALVVAPRLSEEDILETLSRDIDPAFLPRPLYRVEQLPRNETGKLPRKQLLNLLDRMSTRS